MRSLLRCKCAVTESESEPDSSSWMIREGPAGGPAVLRQVPGLFSGLKTRNGPPGGGPVTVNGRPAARMTVTVTVTERHQAQPITGLWRQTALALQAVTACPGRCH